MEEVQPTENAIADHGASLLDHWVVAVLIVDREDSVPLCGKGSKRFGVACGRREWLLTHDVLARVHCQFCQSRVSLVRRTDVDGVDGRIGDQILVVSVNAGDGESRRDRFRPARLR